MPGVFDGVFHVVLFADFLKQCVSQDVWVCIDMFLDGQRSIRLSRQLLENIIDLLNGKTLSGPRLEEGPDTSARSCWM